METLSLEVRTLEPTEVDDAMHVLALAYGASATQGSRAGMQATPQAWLIARRNGDAAGVVTSNIYGRAAYVAMLAVSPTHRRNGVATKLMQTLLGRLEARGVSSVLLDATAEAEALYRSLGFVEIDRTRVYARAAPLPAGDSRPDVASGALARALRLDALVSGCDRSNALRGFALAPYALVLAEDDGYALARGPVLGPFGAADPATAQRLLTRVLRKRPHVDRAFLPLSNPHAAGLFEAHGFHCARTLAHMAFGEPSPFRRDRIYSQASLGHG
jgi:ribosomal-protein-alanine N-acetyltransferase